MPQRFKIKTRLLISFFIVVLFTLIVGITGFISLNTLRATADRTIHNVLVLNSIYDYNVAIDSDIFNLLYISDKELAAYVVQAIREDMGYFHKHLIDYAHFKHQYSHILTPGEMQDIENMLELYSETYVPVINEILELEIQGQREEALAIYINRYTPMFNTFVYHIDVWFIKNLEHSAEETARNSEIALFSSYFMLALVVLSLIISIVLAFAVTKSIAVPLSGLGTAAEKIANGELNAQIDHLEDNDEIGRLSQRLNDTLQQLIQAQHIKLEAVEARHEKEKAEASAKLKGEFLATMSHEIRTPLNAIIGITQIEMQDENQPDKQMTAFDKIHKSGVTLLGIINDILDMSKIETGKMELNPINYDVPSLIYDTVQLNLVRIGSKPVEFILNIDETLPSRLFGDELRIKQILNNLLSNAIKYTDKGQVSFFVNHKTVESDSTGEDIQLVFTVKDSGQGMKEEDKEKLFSEYLRFNTEANRSTEGIGLGLNITKKLIEMMDGTIRVESEYGKGSTFIVTVRQKAVDCEPVGVELAQRLSNFTFISKKQDIQQITREPMPYGSVLVVDDVDTNLYVANGLLLPYKLEIELANSGFAAIEKIENGKTYDVIFMDHMMPQMDGIETTQKLRERGYTGTIVALTANALVGNDEMFAQKSFNGFIAKPIDVTQLNTVLNKFVRDKHPEEAKKYKSETVTCESVSREEAEDDSFSAIDPLIKKVFCADARKAIATLNKTVSESDTKLFTITAHAMKSALANVGESEASQSAFALESAGHKSDMDFINANTESFIKTLDALIKKFNPEIAAEKDAAAGIDASQNITEDTAFLKEQLEIIKKACENYDDDAVYAALDRLKEKTWRKETSNTLEQIRVMLFIYSDFDGVIQRIEALKI